jgi:hypothetical protein
MTGGPFIPNDEDGARVRTPSTEPRRSQSGNAPDTTAPSRSRLRSGIFCVTANTKERSTAVLRKGPLLSFAVLCWRAVLLAQEGRTTEAVKLGQDAGPRCGAQVGFGHAAALSPEPLASAPADRQTASGIHSQDRRRTGT